MVRLASVVLRVSTHDWRNAGFPCGIWKLSETCVSINEGDGAPCLLAGLLGHDGEIQVAGFETLHSLVDCSNTTNEIGLEAIDHLMVRARNSYLTLHELAKSLGVPVSSDENGEESVWLDSVRIDLVPSPELPVPAELWGIAFRVTDIDEVVIRLGGDVIGSPKPARQAGQRVAVFRSRANLGIPTALVDLRG